jgi:hypothetical protein
MVPRKTHRAFIVVEVEWPRLLYQVQSTFSHKETVNNPFYKPSVAVKTDEDNQSAANPGDKLQESGESSDDMNS